MTRERREELGAWLRTLTLDEVRRLYWSDRMPWEEGAVPGLDSDLFDLMRDGMLPPVEKEVRK